MPFRNAITHLVEVSLEEPPQTLIHKVEEGQLTAGAMKQDRTSDGAQAPSQAQTLIEAPQSASVTCISSRRQT